MTGIDRNIDMSPGSDSDADTDEDGSVLRLAVAVARDGDTAVLWRGGEPVAAVVPLEAARIWAEMRDDTMRAAQVLERLAELARAYQGGTGPG